MSRTLDRQTGLPKVVAIGKIPGTRQESATYSKSADAKVTVAESQALANAAATVPLSVARTAVWISRLALICSLVALVKAFWK